MRGLSQNQMSTPHFIYENGQRNKINALADFENETPTHIGTAHANSKVEHKIEFPGNRSKILISSESARFTK